MTPSLSSPSPFISIFPHFSSPLPVWTVNTHFRPIHFLDRSLSCRCSFPFLFSLFSTSDSSELSRLSVRLKTHHGILKKGKNVALWSYDHKFYKHTCLLFEKTDLTEEQFSPRFSITPFQDIVDKHLNSQDSGLRNRQTTSRQKRDQKIASLLILVVLVFGSCNVVRITTK